MKSWDASQILLDSWRRGLFNGFIQANWMEALFYAIKHKREKVYCLHCLSLGILEASMWSLYVMDNIWTLIW